MACETCALHATRKLEAHAKNQNNKTILEFGRHVFHLNFNTNLFEYLIYHIYFLDNQLGQYFGMPVSFFCRQSAANVWKSVTGVSSAGLKRGRGKGTGRAIVKDFNRGQEIGVGRQKLVMAGLNAPVVTANKLVEAQDLGKNQEFSETLSKVRTQMNVYRKYRELPLDRGWSGRKAHGRKAGPPAPHNETEFEGFESTVLMMRNLMNMTGVLGRTKRIHGLVVTGNGNGLAGFSTAVGKDAKGVIRHARNRAGQNLISIERWDNHTVMHDFFSRYYFTTVFVYRKPKGYGIRAHRVIKAICEAFGITDLHAKVEGSQNNVINLTKAFFLGLMNQRKYEDMAEEKRLHLVELREENFNFPMVLASPKSPVRSDHELKNSDENLDFTYYIYDGKIKQIKPEPFQVWENHPMYYKHLDKLDYQKNREKTKLLLAAKYGDRKVLDVFPHFLSTAKSFNNPKEVEQ